MRRLPQAGGAGGRAEQLAELRLQPCVAAIRGGGQVQDALPHLVVNVCAPAAAALEHRLELGGSGVARQGRPYRAIVTSFVSLTAYVLRAVGTPGSAMRASFSNRRVH